MKKRNTAGMTLIEIIIAVTVFAMISAPLLGLFSYALKMERRSMVHALATYTAQMKMEEAYGLDAKTLIAEYTDAPTGSKIGSKSGIFSADEFDDEVFELLYVYTVTPWPDPTDPDYDASHEDLSLYKVTIRVLSNVYNVEATLEDIFYAEPTI